MNKTIWNRLLESWSDKRKSKIQNRKWAGLFATVIALTMCGAGAHAQSSAKVPRIMYLTAATLSANVARVEAFRQGLRELGYVEGENIAIEWRSGAGKLKRESELVAEALRIKTDIIVTSGPTMTRAAKQATATIPIVMTFDTDPVGSGFIASLAQPGGNITGLSALSPELSGKQMELLKEIIPKVSRVAVLGNSNEPANPKTLKEIELAAGVLGVQVQSFDVRGPNEIEPAFRDATRVRADALVVLPSVVLSGQRAKVANLALRSRLPAMYFIQQFVEAGGLVSYGTSFPELSRRAAVYVDKILKGAKPADLPVEQPTKFELVINLKTAKQIGLTIPQSVLYRADRVIR
jgi:putative ABC transport system substrate-binding protein